MNNLSRPGALALAERISNYWRARGYRFITTAVMPLVDTEGGYGQAHLYVVRSNMSDGLPPRHPGHPVAADYVTDARLL